MLCRQIENTKYISLNSEKLINLIKNNRQTLNKISGNLDRIYFVIPKVKMQRGYYVTRMKSLLWIKYKMLN